MEELSLFDYVGIVKQRLRLFLIAFFSLFIVSLLFTANYSNYESTTVIEIQDADIAAAALRETGQNGQGDSVETMANQRISHLQQKVLSVSSLAEIITKFDLYAGARAYTPIEAIAGKMASKIKTALSTNGLGGGSKSSAGPIAFSISFNYSAPLLAQQVTNELVSRFIDEDLKERRTETEETSAFLAAQIKQMDASLVEQEKNIANYRSKHGDTRPEAFAFNQQNAVGLSMNIQAIDTQLANNEATLASIRAQLATVDPYTRVMTDGQILTTPSIQLRALKSQLASLLSQYSSTHPDVIKTKRQIEALKAQTGITDDGIDQAEIKAHITDIQTNLAAAQKTHGPENPDVQNLQKQLKNLQQMQAEATTSKAIATKIDADNPAYLQLTIQLESALQQQKSLQEQKKSLQAQQRKYQGAVAANPVVEQEMATLTRDYDSAQLRYRALKEKKMSADMQLQMQTDHKGPRLVVINPPELPLKTKPGRALLVLGGFFFAALFGAAVVMAAQIISPTIVSANHLTNLVGLAPLVVVPHISTTEERENRKKRKGHYYIAGATAIILAIALFSLLVMPLDVMFTVIAQRLGLV